MSEQNQTASSVSSVVFNNPNPLMTQNLFPELEGIENVEIDQNTGCIDCIGPCCLPNKYVAYYPGTDKKLFEFEEKSDCCERWCCFKCRSFNMRIYNSSKNSNIVSIILEGDKNCAGGVISCFGCGKPKMSIRAISPQGYYLGKVAMNWDSCCCVSCCHPRIEILDNTGQIKYTIFANCFSIGSYCSKCTKCCDILYHIVQDNKRVGSMTKIPCDSCRICCTKADQFTINLPKLATQEEKMLLIIGCILIDYQSFYA